MTQQAPLDWLDDDLGGYSIIQDEDGNPLPQENIIQIVGYESLVDDSSNRRSVLTIPSAAVPSYPLSDPSVEGVSVFLPETTSPTTYADVASVIVTGQTTSASYNAVTMLTIPLPGTTGAPCSKGQFDLDVEISMVSTTTAVGARFKLSWSWAVITSGSPSAMGTLVTSLSIGTNAGNPPSGWAATIALDGTSKDALVKITGDATLDVDVRILAQYGYLQ